MAIAERPPALELPTPPGWLPVERCWEAVNEYRAGGSRDALVQCIDRDGQFLEAAIARRLARDVDDYRLTVRQIQRLAEQITLGLAQKAWLRAFPRRAPEPGPVLCRLRTGTLVPVTAVLGVLGNLALDPQPAPNSELKFPPVAQQASAHHDTMTT